MTKKAAYLEYKGAVPVDIRQKVILIDEDANEIPATVQVLLAVQFIAHSKKQGNFFRFYADKGVTWKEVA